MALKDEELNPLIESIMKILNNLIEEPFIKMVLLRLDSFGYTPSEDDSWVIAFSIQAVKNTIQNKCNVSSIPEGLLEIAIDRTCGEILFVLKQSGKLDESFNIEVAIKQVQAGDTNVTFAIGDGTETNEQRLNALINYLMTKGEGEFVCYRKIKW